jgi:hypothetical protein
MCHIEVRKKKCPGVHILVIGKPGEQITRHLIFLIIPDKGIPDGHPGTR